MREVIEETPFGCRRLLVFPFASADMTDQQMASLGRVEALCIDGRHWGVRINIAFNSPGGYIREETDALKSAIDRCWQWIAEEESINLSKMSYSDGLRGLQSGGGLD